MAYRLQYPPVNVKAIEPLDQDLPCKSSEDDMFTHGEWDYISLQQNGQKQKE